MNAVTIQQTTQGLLRYLREQEPQRLQASGIVIGFDGRHHSREFATIAAACAVAAGVPVWLFSELVPTPFVPAAVQQLVSGRALAFQSHAERRRRKASPIKDLSCVLQGCAGGVMVTASHNPKQYNGYKVYWTNTCQIIPPHDAGIAAAIERELGLWELPPLESISYGHPLVRDPLQQVADEYYSQLRRHLWYRGAEANASAPAVAYTALHGVGTPWLLRAFREFGLPAPILVQQQCQPDPDFSTGAERAC